MYEDTINALARAKGRVMREIKIEDNKLRIAFQDGSRLEIWDDGQSCCETRYMSTDDQIEHYQTLVFMGVEVRDGPNRPDTTHGEEHEQQFLLVKTPLGEFTIVNHNEHNGYYGGFGLAASFTP